MVFCASVGCHSMANSAVWYVRSDLSSSGDGTTWGGAFVSIPEAITAASPADEIWVQGGTYAIVAEIIINKQVFMYGGFAGTEVARDSRNFKTNVTSIDGQDAVRCIQLTSGAAGSRIDGFTITNGHSSNGAGVLIIAASTIISNCTISSNISPDYAGGIYVATHSVRIENNTISNNTALTGGGIYNSFVSSTIDNCLIENNSASSGGGIFNDGGFAPIITNNIIKGNYASNKGGGICNDDQNDAIISGNIIVLNIASARGGGVYSGQDSGSNTNAAEVQLTNNVIANNWATWGGGLYNATRSSVKVINNTIAGNTAATAGAGMYVYYQYSYTSAMNSVFYGNVLDAGGDANIYFEYFDGTTGSAATNLRLLYNNFSVLIPSWHNSGAPSRIGNIGVFAGFADYNGPDGNPLAGGDSDYHIADDSDMVDQGISSYSTYSLIAPSLDLDGNLRPNGIGYDLGAYEAGYPFNTEFTITASVSPPEGGSVVCNPNPVTDGETSICTITVSEQYNLQDVTGTCGGTLVGTTYTTDAIITDCSVIAGFKLRGDVNNNDTVDLEDIILGLQILAGKNTTGISTSGDVNNDQKIGMEEVLYDLKRYGQ